MPRGSRVLRDRRGWEIRPTRSKAVPGKGLERMRIKGETFPLLIIEAQSVMLISPPSHPLLLTPSHIPWPYYPYFQFRHSPLFYTRLDPQGKRGPRRTKDEEVGFAQENPVNRRLGEKRVQFILGKKTGGNAPTPH
ncbi:hypothetical protein KQX54_004128 [Cotesia glomerata]|uniref:Uncharacterized protein n=1 Tax=Cotesia glomerata TaxID=32391 RepID=A0AAV7ICG8_COTGL|nr:hypothetical protein KQX54_004128 [Cotesia glomerata]